MDVRDIIALTVTVAFTVGGFYWIVAQRLRFHRRQAMESRDDARPSAWQRLSPRQKFLRRLMGVALGIAVALLIRVVAVGLIDALAL